MQINTQIVSGIDLWCPKDADQRILWPSTVTLSADYFDSLTTARRPARQPRRCGAGRIRRWPGHLRLACPTPAPHPQGQAADDHMAGAQGAVRPGLCRLRDFRRKFVQALKTVLTAYPSARIEIADAGLVLWNSPPPVLKRQVSMPRLNPLTIDATATEITDT